MKNLFPCLILIFSISIFSSCKRENCPDITFEDQALETISKTYFAGQGANVLIYLDTSGTEHRYDLVPNEERLYTILAQDTCENDLNVITYKSEYILRRFSTPDETSIVFVQIVDFPEYKAPFTEDRIADILKMSIYNDSTPSPYISRICFMTSSKQGTLNQSAYNMDQFISHDSLSFGNKTFYDVLEQKTGGPKMFYTPSEGIVSFTDKNETTLVLDRIE